MARPSKFRHPLEDLTKPHLAAQIAGYVAEIELYRQQVEEIQSKIAAVYDDMDEEGFDKAIVRKLVVKRAKGEKAEAEADALDAYELAVERGFSSRARVGNPKTTEHQSAPISAERDPQSAQHGSDSVGGAGGESPGIVAGSEQGSANDEARNEPGSAAAASGGEGLKSLPETPSRKPFVLRPHCQRPEMCGSYGAKHCAECERAAKAGDDDVEDAIPAFVRKTHHHTMGEQA